jgi:hypothetical protein
MFIDVQGAPLGSTDGPSDLPGMDRLAVIRRLLLGNFVSGGSNAVIRKTCLDEVGPFDEGLRAAEDWDMWLRIALRHSIAFVTRPLSVVRVNPHSMSAPRNVASMLEKELKVLRKHCTGRERAIGAYDRAMAYAHRYGYSACAYLTIGDTRQGRRYILKAMWSNPLHFVRQRDFLAALARLMLGDRVFAWLLRSPRGRRPA